MILRSMSIRLEAWTMYHWRYSVVFESWTMTIIDPVYVTIQSDEYERKDSWFSHVVTQL
jgi:hypothetical protein